MSTNFLNKLTYCGRQTYLNDNDRFILSLCLPAKYREAMWTLFAYNYEISKTKEVVSEPMLGKLRLQWWIDSISEIYTGTVKEHEILKPLSVYIKEFSIPQEHLIDLITARNIEFENLEFKTKEDLFDYSASITVPLNKMCLKILDETIEEKALNDLSVCYSLLGIMRSTHYLSMQNICYLPLDILKANNVSPKDIINLKSAKENEISLIIKELSNIASVKLDNINATPVFSKKLKKITRAYLSHLSAVKYNPFHPRFSQQVPFLYLKLLI